MLSWIFSIACTVACTFVKITQTTTAFAGYGSAYSNTPAQSYASYEYFFGFQGADLGNGECTTADIEDDRIRTAFAFAVINNILTTASLIGAPLVMFNVTKDADAANKAWKIIGFLLLASTWCCLFTFYIHQTRICDAIDIECSLGGAGIAQVFNSMLLILICALFFVLPPPASEGGEGNDEDAKKDKNDVEMKEKQVKPQSQHRTTLSRRAKDESDDDEEEGGEGKLQYEDSQITRVVCIISTPWADTFVPLHSRGWRHRNRVSDGGRHMYVYRAVGGR